MPSLLELAVGGDGSPWFTLGLCVAERPQIADVAISFVDARQGHVAWTVSTERADCVEVSIDGIPTTLVPRHDAESSTERGHRSSTPFGAGRAIAIDHVVVNTDDLMRTSTAISETLGCELRRVRDAGRGVTQGFHVLDNTVVEVVSGPHISGTGASLWGFVVVVDDLDAVATSLGDLVTPTKAAVQPGRFIASFMRDAGLGLPVALMSPR